MLRWGMKEQWGLSHSDHQTPCAGFCMLWQCQPVTLYYMLYVRTAVIHNITVNGRNYWIRILLMERFHRPVACWCSYFFLSHSVMHSESHSHHSMKLEILICMKVLAVHSSEHTHVMGEVKPAMAGIITSCQSWPTLPSFSVSSTF